MISSNLRMSALSFGCRVFNDVLFTIPFIRNDLWYLHFSEDPGSVRDTTNRRSRPTSSNVESGISITDRYLF